MFESHKDNAVGTSRKQPFMKSSKFIESNTEKSKKNTKTSKKVGTAAMCLTLLSLSHEFGG